MNFLFPSRSVTVALFFCVLLCALLASAAKQPPNFVVLLTDDQSWVGTSLRIDPDDEQSQSDYYQTPNIERMATMGMRFTRGYAPAPFCCPTRRSLLIGQTSAKHIYQKDQQNWTTRYREQLTLPQMLKRANPKYQTAHFGKWDMRFDEFTPQEVGYDVSDGYTNNSTGGGKGAGGPAASDDPKLIFNITKNTCDFMETQTKAGNPFFVQVSHYAVHLDIFYREKSLEKARASKIGKKHTMPEFAAMTSNVDEGIGMVLDKIESLGLSNTTYIFFLSDNGGRNTIPKQEGKELHRNHPLREGKGTVYEGGIRVPFVVIGPGVESGAVSRTAVTGLDIFPTIAELANYSQPLPKALDGGSMTQVMFDGGKGSISRNHPFLIFHQAVSRDAESALIEGNFKLVKDWKRNRLELFNLSKDIGEENNLSEKMPKKTERMHELMVAFFQEEGTETSKTGSKAETYKNAKPTESTSPKKSDSKASAKKASSATPNVLFLSIDDLNDWIGALGGHPQAKTPNLDRLISKGVLFSNAHCTAPVCGASRHSLLSGLRPSTTGWYSNGSKKRSDYERILGETVPLPTHFKHNGYKTMAAGKVFHKGTSDISGYDYWTEARPKYRWPKELAAHGHGYQGNSGGHFHPFPPDGGAIYQKYQEGVSGQSLCWGALEKQDMPPEGMPDVQIADWAVERLNQKHDKPFFLAVGFIRPHVPYTAPKEFFDLYPMKDIIVPQVPEDELDDIPLHGKAMAHGTLKGGDHWNVLSIGPNYWKEMTRAYLACVSFVDAQAGKVLDALEASPYADNTIIVFWSDHGQHIGEKRHWRKQALWEESTRVPLSFHVPGNANAGRSCDRAVSLLDIYPSLIDLCGLPPMKGLEGISLSPQLDDPEARRSEPAVTTWYYNNHSVRGPRWRYIRYRDGSEELYNHETDPLEHINQTANPKFAKIKARLRKYLPTKNVLPSSMEDGGLDSYGKRVDRLRTEGIPEWLGKDPSETAKN
ncbi:sulfatase-like hydrolase/transferase [bacterium]|nr:sulfatase-like hydrolase/transferase [bacterium]